MVPFSLGIGTLRELLFNYIQQYFDNTVCDEHAVSDR